MANDDMIITAPPNIIIPARTIQLIVGLIHSEDSAVSNVLVEPSSKLPNHLCLARSLSPLLNQTEVIFEHKPYAVDSLHRYETWYCYSRV